MRMTHLQAGGDRTSKAHARAIGVFFL